MLLSSALSIRHTTMELFIRLVSCYSEAESLHQEKGLAWVQVVHHSWQLHSKVFLIHPTSHLSLLINAALSCTHYLYSEEAQEIWNNPRFLLFTSYWKSCNHCEITLCGGIFSPCVLFFGCFLGITQLEKKNSFSLEMNHKPRGQKWGIHVSMYSQN